ncbi:putative UDP-glucuronate decarboxylase [Helianthus anomalus]
MQVRIVRIFNTYGPRMCIYDNFFAQVLRKESLTVYGDGKQTRSFQYVSDLFLLGSNGRVTTTCVYVQIYFLGRSCAFS